MLATLSPPAILNSFYIFFLSQELFKQYYMCMCVGGVEGDTKCLHSLKLHVYVWERGSEDRELALIYTTHCMEEGGRVLALINTTCACAREG